MSSTTKSRSPRSSQRWASAVPAFIFATAPVGGLIADLAELIAPQGRVALINGEAADLFVFRAKERVHSL